jgi:putative ABC transport system permease protein
VTINLLRLALKNIRSRRTRSWLTILGVLVGVTAIVALLSIGTGVEVAVLQQFEDIGYDIILIAPAGAGQAARAAAGGLAGAGRFGQTPGSAPEETARVPQAFSPEGLSGDTEDTDAAAGSRLAELAAQLDTGLDAERLLQQVPQLEEAGVLGTQVLPVRAGTTTGFLRVSTPSRAFLDAFPSILGGFALTAGSSFTDPLVNQVVVGGRTAERLGLGAGDAITIGGESFTVVGVLTSTGSGEQPGPEEQGPLSGQGLAQNLGGGGASQLITRGLANTDDALFVLEERATELFSGRAALSVTIVRVASGASIQETMDALTVAIAEQDATGTPISVQEIAEEIQGTLGLIETVLASIAAVALVVGGVGLMNTMYTAVLERTREIGILKSVGARDGQVMTLFLIDSGVMGLIGGMLGLILGALLSVFGTQLLGPSLGVGAFAPVISASLITGVLAFSFVLGAVSGVWPAWRAARLHPVEALASE